jgi:hypothetical protein
MQNIETNVIIEGYQIEACIEDYVQDAGLVYESKLDDRIDNYLSDGCYLTGDDDLWGILEYDVQEAINSNLSEYFSSYGDGSDRIQEHVESTLPEWLVTQLAEMPEDENTRCALGKAFTSAVNKAVATTDTNVEWATKVEALEARVFALEEVINSMSNSWAEVNTRNPYTANAAHQKYADSVAKITEALS